MTTEVDDLSGLTGAPLRRRLSLSFLACLPLLFAYELGVHASALEGASLRNTSELFCSQLVELLGGGAVWRWGGLAILALAAAGRALHFRWPLGEGVLWSTLEGAGLGLLMGPLMMVLLGGLLDWLPETQLVAESGSAPIELMALVVGGAAWEELLFRVLLFAALFMVARGLLGLLGAGPERSQLPSELFAILFSSLAFAAFHLESVIGWLGAGGEPYDFRLFAWRTFAGLLLAVIARTRGLGVAAWTHAVFNIGLVLGSGPGVFLMIPGRSVQAGLLLW